MLEATQPPPLPVKAELLQDKRITLLTTREGEMTMPPAKAYLLLAAMESTAPRLGKKTIPVVTLEAMDIVKVSLTAMLLPMETLAIAQ